MRLFFVAALLCPLMLVVSCRKSGPSRTADPETGAVMTAAAAVDRFHAELGAGKTDDICKFTAPGAFAPASQLGCAEFLRDVHSKLGAFVSAKRPQLPIAAAGPLRVGMEYIATYQNGQAREHFEYAIQGSQAMLMRFRIAADALASGPRP